MDKIEKSTKKRGYTLREALNRYTDKSVSDVPKKEKTFLDEKLGKTPKNVSPAQHYLYGGSHWNDPSNRGVFGPGTKDRMPGADNQKQKSYKMRGFT
jgi:hypothetical protein